VEKRNFENKTKIHSLEKKFFFRTEKIKKMKENKTKKISCFDLVIIFEKDFVLEKKIFLDDT
jgi:hypothetical protein